MASLKIISFYIPNLRLALAGGFIAIANVIVHWVCMCVCACDVRAYFLFVIYLLMLVWEASDGMCVSKRLNVSKVEQSSSKNINLKSQLVPSIFCELLLKAL